MQSQNNCFESGGDYATCMAQSGAGYDPYSKWALDVNAYAEEASTNPYVVGGAAWRALHPAAAAELDRFRTAQAAAVNPITAQGIALPPVAPETISGPQATVAQTVSASPTVLLLGVLALIALFKR